MVKIISHYDDDKPVVEEVFTAPSMTQQHFKESCDINNILKKFSAGDISALGELNAEKSIYADVSDFVDFQQNQNRLIRGKEYFASLPSSVRAEFNNDPAVFAMCLSDPRFADRFRELGILPKLDDHGDPSAGSAGSADVPPASPPADSGDADGSKNLDKV